MGQSHGQVMKDVGSGGVGTSNAPSSICVTTFMQNTEAVNIDLDSDGHAFEPFWGNISFGTPNICYGSSLVGLQKFGQSKITNFWGKRVIKKYILGLDVAMYDLGAAFFVHIAQPSCSSKGNLHPLIPPGP
ncbi:hypothetical protein RJ641_007314 [Dillenia turbinata]|uniref:Uncharacterized protein n=1 Tax=Dillenia turbinata TaxID=194707 RepID=A0AAN8V170_9MAGN